MWKDSYIRGDLWNLWDFSHRGFFLTDLTDYTDLSCCICVDLWNLCELSHRVFFLTDLTDGTDLSCCICVDLWNLCELSHRGFFLTDLTDGTDFSCCICVDLWNLCELSHRVFFIRIKRITRIYIGASVEIREIRVTFSHGFNGLHGFWDRICENLWDLCELFPWIYSAYRWVIL